MFFGLNKFFNQSISLRLTLLFSTTFSLCLVSALFFTYFQVSHSLAKSNREVLNSKWLEAATLLSKNGLPGLKDFMLAEQNSLRNVEFMFRVVNDESQTLFLKSSIQDAEFDFEKYFDAVKTISPQDIKDLANKYFQEKDLIELVVGKK